MPKKKCTYCKERFDKESMIHVGIQSFCTDDHRKEYMIDKKLKSKSIASLVTKGKEIKRKEQKKEDAKRKKELRPKSWYTKEAQKWFNKYIRLRDRYETCICCERPHHANIQWHAGHFLTVGARPEHRFNEDNCHKQTSYCNNHKSGNVAEYRKKLIVKIGLDRVEAIEQDHKPKNYTIEDLKLIIVKYKVKCKELE